MVTPIRVDRSSPRWKRALLLSVPILMCLAVTTLVALVFLRSVDLKPKVGENFFFSKNDPQVRADNEISRTFPEMTEIDLTVGGNISSPAYAERIRILSDDLSKVPGVTGVVSLNPGKKNHGPKDLDDALKSTLWTHILIAKDHKSTDVIATVKDNVGPTTINALQALQRKFRTEARPCIRSEARTDAKEKESGVAMSSSARGAASRVAGAFDCACGRRAVKASYSARLRGVRTLYVPSVPVEKCIKHS
jgi:hypothetical protein